MKALAPRRVAAGLVVVLAALGATATYVLRARPALPDLERWARTRGITIESVEVERGWSTDRLRDVRARLPGGAAIRAPEAALSRPLFADPALTLPELRIALTGSPIEALAQAAELREPDGLALHLARVSVDYRNRDLGALLLGGVSARGEGEPRKWAAETLKLGNVSWPGALFSIEKRRTTLEMVFGADRSALPRATLTYVPSDGRAAEWRAMVPHQPLDALAGALGLGGASRHADARISGTVSFIVPERDDLTPRGSFRFVLDAWPPPPWPEASALIGSSGSLAAVFVPSPEHGGFRIERVEVAAALFDLRGSGSLSVGDSLRGTIAARGRRTCAELAESLPPSRHRQAVGAFLVAGPGATASRPPAGPSAARGGESVELSVQVDFSSGAEGELKFHWKLTPGCGLEMPPASAPHGE